MILYGVRPQNTII